MLHPEFPLSSDGPDFVPIRRLLEAAALLRRRAHLDPANRNKLIAAAERAEAWCRCRRGEPEDIFATPVRIL